MRARTQARAPRPAPAVRTGTVRVPVGPTTGKPLAATRAAGRGPRRWLALAAAAAAVVLAAALAIAGLAAGTRAAQPDDLGRVSQTGVVVE